MAITIKRTATATTSVIIRREGFIKKRSNYDRHLSPTAIYPATRPKCTSCCVRNEPILLWEKLRAITTDRIRIRTHTRIRIRIRFPWSARRATTRTTRTTWCIIAHRSRRLLVIATFVVGPAVPRATSPGEDHPA